MSLVSTVFCIIYFLFIFSQTVLCQAPPPKSEILTSSFTTKNGVSLIYNWQEVTVNQDTGQWDINVATQSSWHFIITLDNSWGFDPFRVTRISLTVDSPTLATINTFDDIVFGFTAPGVSQYFSSWIPMDNLGQKNRIYPACDTSPTPTQTFGVGNVAELPAFDRNCDIAGGKCSNWNTMLPKNAQFPTVYERNAFPITFTLENNPLKNTFFVYFETASFSTTFIQKCGFVSFPTGRGLKMYIGGNDPGHSFTINSFSLTSDSSTLAPTQNPTTATPTTANPTQFPTKSPTHIPTRSPSKSPTKSPTKVPTKTPTKSPSFNPSKSPTLAPSNAPSSSPSQAPSLSPSIAPSNAPSSSPTNVPSNSPSSAPTPAPTHVPTKSPTKDPTVEPTISPSMEPTTNPSRAPSKKPTLNPTKAPTMEPTISPSMEPTMEPTKAPSDNPTTAKPTSNPSKAPSEFPTIDPTMYPTMEPTTNPSQYPSDSPTTAFPSKSPSNAPSNAPSDSPTAAPSLSPSFSPSMEPTLEPTLFPSEEPSNIPTQIPTEETLSPTTHNPTKGPTFKPTQNPSVSPLVMPSAEPTMSPLERVLNGNEIKSENVNHANIVSAQLGDLILPVSLVVLVGACALCSVVIVIIRQLCVKQHRGMRHKKPQQYINALPLTPQHDNDDDGDDHNRHRGRPALSDTDSMKARYIHQGQKQHQHLHVGDDSNAQTPNRINSNIVNDGHNHEPLTIPLKATNRKTTFCRKLVAMNSKNNVMMDDIIDDIELHPHSNPLCQNKTTKYELANAEDMDLDISSTLSDDNSDDTMMEKPHHHNYSTMTLRSGMRIVDNLSNQTLTTNDSMITMNGAAANNGYHQITRSNFGRLQHAINNAKTHSDFEKLEKIIKKGRIPKDNWHGKGKEYEQNALHSVDENGSESSMDSKSESSDICDNAQSLLPVPNMHINDDRSSAKSKKRKKKKGHFSVNKSVPLDGNELSNKLKKVKKDRIMVREKQRKRKNYNQYSNYNNHYHHGHGYMD